MEIPGFFYHFCTKPTWAEEHSDVNKYFDLYKRGIKIGIKATKSMYKDLLFFVIPLISYLS